jgi:hypothetical protein
LPSRLSLAKVLRSLNIIFFISGQPILVASWRQQLFCGLSFDWMHASFGLSRGSDEEGEV